MTRERIGEYWCLRIEGYGYHCDLMTPDKSRVWAFRYERDEAYRWATQLRARPLVKVRVVHVTVFGVKS